MPALAAGVARGRDDQPGLRLGLLVDRLDDHEVVERLERRRIRAAGLRAPFEDTAARMALSLRRARDRRAAPSRSRTPTRSTSARAGLTKLDHVQYYVAVDDGIVRALYERPTQLKRHPGGAEDEAIYQKRVPAHAPDWIETARVTFPSGRHADELCVTEVAQVAWAANLGTIDFHPWPSRRRDTEHPDELRIDVDPQPGTTFADGEARRGGRARGARRDRLHGLAEDVRATGASTSSAASSRTGASASCAAARSRSRARWSGACPSS